MMKKGVWVLILVLSVAITAWKIWERNKITKSSDVKIIGYQDYKNLKAGYRLKIPQGWVVVEASEEAKFVARTVIKRTVGYSVGNIGEISITVVATPSANQPFSRRSEFIDWREKPDEIATGTGTIKLKNEEVAGLPAVRIAEVDMVPEDIEQSWWSVTTWFVKDNINYYLNMMGNGSLTEEEYLPFEKMLSSFQ